MVAIEERVRRITVMAKTLYSGSEVIIRGPFLSGSQIGWCEPHALRFQANVGNQQGAGATIEDALTELEENIRAIVQGRADDFRIALVESSEP